MTYYVGILEGARKTWGVRFPDLPGCHGGGATAEAAIADAVSALSEYAAELQRRKMPLPKPRSLSDLQADPESRPDPGQGERAVMVPLLLDRGRMVRANLTLMRDCSRPSTRKRSCAA